MELNSSLLISVVSVDIFNLNKRRNEFDNFSDFVEAVIVNCLEDLTI